jgi:hypothetical protein
MNAESLDIYHDAEERLNGTENQQRDVMAAFPEAPAQAREENARHESKEEEAEDVVPVSHIAAADRSRCKEMPKQANAEEYYAEPNPAAASPLDGNNALRLH